MEGFRQLAALHLDPALQNAVSNPFPASYSDKVRQVGVVNTKNKVMTESCREVARRTGRPAPSVDRKIHHGGFYPAASPRGCRRVGGLCPQGGRRLACILYLPDGSRDDDPMAVTDNQGRVRGIDGLRVVDASIFPSCLAQTRTSDDVGRKDFRTRFWRRGNENSLGTDSNDGRSTRFRASRFWTSRKASPDRTAPCCWRNTAQTSLR